MDLKRITDEAKNGVVETYHDNGQLKTRTNYKNDILNGLYESWYKNGQYRDWETDRKSTRLNSSHSAKSRMPSSA